MRTCHDHYSSLYHPDFSPLAAVVVAVALAVAVVVVVAVAVVVVQELGWKLLLQIHDEVILEGPKESKELAMVEVRACMEYPYDDVLAPLKVHLDVDAKCADSWYKAK